MNAELKIVWGGEVNSSGADVLRFGVRLVEDSIYGKRADSWGVLFVSYMVLFRMHVVCGSLV